MRIASKLYNLTSRAKEMQMALHAYMKVARKRFIDTVPMVLQTNLVGKLIKEVKKSLLLGDSDLEKLLTESPSILKRRGELKSALIALRAAKLEVGAMQ
jgi:hypothetical protein